MIYLLRSISNPLIIADLFLSEVIKNLISSQYQRYHDNLQVVNNQF